ncbi:bacteriophage protein, partial [Pantoea ananatis]
IAGYNGSPDEAGNYPDRKVGMIFNGDIRFTVAGKDNVTDSWLLLQCIDGWQGHLYASVRTTVAAGWKYSDLFEAGMKTYQPYGITAVSVPDFPDTVFPRGRVLVGNTSDVMYGIARKCQANWWFENNQVNIVPESKYIDEVVVLNSSTGLIGMPQQTMGAGVNVRCLINPAIKLGGLVRLDQASVYRVALSNDQIGRSPARVSESASDGNLYVNGIPGSQPAAINTDGDYTVGSIDYTGDTRGQNWYMDLLCLAKGSKDLLNSKGLDAAQYT